jgi:hypothetical protein
MMSILTISCIFVAAFIVAMLRGVGWAFVAVYIPSLILLNQLPQVHSTRAAGGAIRPAIRHHSGAPLPR